MSSSSAVVASTTGRATPKLRTVRGTSSANTCLCVGLVGLTKIAIFEALGISSRKISISFCDEISWRVGRKTRHVAAGTRQTLDEAERHRIEHRHEYNRNASGCRFQGYGCLWVGGDEHIGAESYQLGGESWQAILGGGIMILDDQVSSINPAVVSQPLKPRFLNGRLHHIHREKANPTTYPLRPQTLWRNEQRRSSRYELPPLHSILIAA